MFLVNWSPPFLLHNASFLNEIQNQALVGLDSKNYALEKPIALSLSYLIGDTILQLIMLSEIRNIIYGKMIYTRCTAASFFSFFHFCVFSGLTSGTCEIISTLLYLSCWCRNSSTIFFGCLLY